MLSYAPSSSLRLKPPTDSRALIIPTDAAPPTRPPSLFFFLREMFFFPARVNRGHISLFPRFGFSPASGSFARCGVFFSGGLAVFLAEIDLVRAIIVFPLPPSSLILHFPACLIVCFCWPSSFIAGLLGVFIS